MAAQTFRESGAPSKTGTVDTLLFGSTVTIYGVVYSHDLQLTSPAKRSPRPRSQYDPAARSGTRVTILVEGPLQGVPALSTNSEDAQRRAGALLKKEQQLRDGQQAMAEYQAELQATREKTARLRALRLARDAADKTKTRPAKVTGAA